MAASARKLIRKFVAELLKEELAAVEKRVFSNRFHPFSTTKTPFVAVYTLEEPAEVYNEAPREMERRLNLVVEICGSSLDQNDMPVDDALDDMAQSVEEIMAKDHTLGGLCRDVILSNTAMATDFESGKNVASCVLTFSIPYYTLAVALGEEQLGDFATLVTKIKAKLTGDAEAEVEDQLSIPIIEDE